MFLSLFKYLRLVIGWLDLMVLTSLLYPLSFLPKNWLSKFYPQLFRYWCHLFVRAVNVDLRLHQKNKTPLPPQYILIANHPSAFEDVGIPALFDVRSLAKIEVKDWWFVGNISIAAGTLFVKRESKTSRNDASKAIEYALKQGKNIALYPEGGCKGRRIFKSFRYGAFAISIRTGIPILPVFLHYEAQQTFEWSDPQTLLDKIWHFIHCQNNRANYYLFDAFDPTQFDNAKDYSEYAHQQYLLWQQRYLD